MSLLHVSRLDALRPRGGREAEGEGLLLDRPNPVRADVLEGPPADDDALSFVAYHTTPIRTGMTIGELATL